MNKEFMSKDKKKYYRVQANVNLEAIRHNLKEIRKKLKSDTKLMAVIKADAYGHGAVALAKAIGNSASGIDYYGVAIIEEAVELREAGIDKPILILGYTPKEQYDLVVAYDVAQTIFQYEMGGTLTGSKETE
jgi:alanine racemase